jgi:hypothetical protein
MAEAEVGVTAAPDPEPADPLVLVREAARRSWPWIAGAAVVLAMLGALFGRRASWGDVATWVLAVTGLLALVAAVFAGLVAYAVLAVEMRRDQVAAADRRRGERERADQREAARRAQAASVAAWYGTWMSSATFSGGSQAGTRMSPHWGAIISNASHLPVYDVRVSFCVPVSPGAGLTWRQGERFLAQVPIVPPGEQHVDIPDHIKTQEEQSGSEPAWLVAIEFTDADSQRWLREPQGKLSPAG